jgi:RHS repeat-associated protein
MKEQEQNKPGSDFFNTDKGKSDAIAIEAPTISLPSGGGAIKGIDEKFSVNAANGTSSFTIPLPFSNARGATPSLNISYNSGAGNGIFGLGWNLTLPSVKRKTEKELPQYLDNIDSDTFMFSETEDLVPEFKKNIDGSFQTDSGGDYIINEYDSTDGLFTIRYYRPRIEGAYARIERWKEKASGIVKWRIISNDNTTSLFGWSANSRIANPEKPTQIFEWMPEFVFDDKGNCSRYFYKKENADGFDTALLHHKNRLKGGDITYTNTYVEKICYGNKTPYKNFGDTFPEASDFLFSTVFDYGEYNESSPYEQIKNWDFRTDAFSNYKPGFEIRTTRLCKRVLLYHHFKNTNEYEGLVKSVNFSYDTGTEEDFTFLSSFTITGYIKKPDGSYSFKSLPSLEFTYSQHEWNTEIRELTANDLTNTPSGPFQAPYQFHDLFNEGLSGILTEQANGLYYKHNLGEGNFEPLKSISPKPSFTGVGNTLTLTDLDADGTRQLVSYEAATKGYFELSDDEQWSEIKSFKTLPNINFKDANARLLDLNGDGKADLLISEDHVFTMYLSEGRDGYAPHRKISKSFNEEDGPHLVFADSKETIFLADMSGDGLTDIVRIRNSSICYWPNMGYGHFGAKVTLDNTPAFDHPDAFNPRFIKISDLDGSGTADIIYLGKNKFTCYKNLSGNRFAVIPFEIDPFPEVYNRESVTIADLLGTGLSCIIWSSVLEKNRPVPLKYIDLMNSKKPHIMVSYKNNMGKEVFLEYTPSTKFYIDDKIAGKPWVTKLHFPVYCVSKSTIEDKIGGSKYISEYTYHHGYFDHKEREFRGFGMVEQTDSETFEHWVKSGASNITEQTLHQEPVVTKTWFHTGAYLRNKKILAQFEDDYWYNEMARQGFTITHPEIALADARIIAAPGLNSNIISSLSADEMREAYRACKSRPLRSETFAKDAVSFGNTTEAQKRELTPYNVQTRNCVIELLQPRGKNKHAVFIVKESESISYDYERDTSDPRIAHSLNVKLDEFGNILESAAVVYPRMVSDSTLPAETQQEQAKTIISYTKNTYTNHLDSATVYRLPLPSEVKSFELKGVPKSGTFYSPDEFEDILSDTRSDKAHYHELDKPLNPGKAQRRLIEHTRSIYYNNNLTGALPLHQLESLAIPYESYQLAYTPELITNIFGTRVNAPLLTEGKYVHSEGDNNWWVRSGTINFIAGGETVTNAQDRFYTPISYTEPFGAVTKVFYYGNYFMMVEETEDALGNKASIPVFNFRTLAAKRMVDINGNISEAISDELGITKAIAIMGKGNEADELTGLTEVTDIAESNLVSDFLNAPDSVLLAANGKNLLQRATNRFVYDLNSYAATGNPLVSASISREQHFAQNADSAVQIYFEYSNGLGEVVMKKIQATPGIAKQVAVNPDNTIVINEIDTSFSIPKQLRWLGSGRTIKNNKGNVVKQYEPYFAVSHHYEDYKELVETGVTPFLYYDAPGRLIRSEMPDGTFTKVVFNSWQQALYDANDTVSESEWYLNRTSRLIDAELIAEGKDPGLEKIASDNAAKHYDTPKTLHFDTMGRVILMTEHNKHISTEASEFYNTQSELDVEGNLRKVIDARGNEIMIHKFDMLGTMVYQQSADSGQRWSLDNVIGDALRSWDERNHEFQYFYDILRRPVYSKIIGGDGSAPLDNIFGRVFYGEDQLLPGRANEAILQASNILGRTVRQYDTGGLVETPSYDFKGQILSSSRRLFSKYKEVPNWIDANLITDLESDTFTFATETDALGRMTTQTAPDGSVINAFYNESGLLDIENILHPGAVQPITYIKKIEYNEKGQRERILYGNDVNTKYYYDKKSFRLIRLESKRLNNDPLQDWRYTYDAVGNITHINDHNIPVVFFNNQKITGITTYTYDAIYRLVAANGRENNTAFTFNAEDRWNDQPFMPNINHGDPMVMRNYTQSYTYDKVGNISSIQHAATGNNWIRNYNYEALSNRLINTQAGGFTYNYQHHTAHGYITELPHLQELGWNFKEQLVKSIRQKRNDGGTPETTWYQYDGSGQRLRKITENEADPGLTPTKKEERVYIAGYELYKKHSGTYSGLERETLSLIDKGKRFVMIETRNGIDDGSDAKLLRYQLHNHIGSAALELDENAEVISYEEYHPFGTTAYQAKNAAIKSVAKRYRFTGMERDEETGLQYHSARYYLPWLGRWLNADPIGLGDGVNVYRYSHNRPLVITDRSGKQGFWEWQAEYWTGVGDGALELAEGVGNMIVHPIDTAGAIADSVSQAYEEDGVLMAVNQVNPAYHAMVAGYEYYQAASRGEARESGRQAFRTVTNVLGTVAIATGGAGLVTGGGTGSATATVPAITSRAVPVITSEVPALIRVPAVTTTVVTVPPRVIAGAEVAAGTTMMMASQGGDGGSGTPPPSSGSGSGSPTPSQSPAPAPTASPPSPRPPRPRRRRAPAAPQVARFTAEAAAYLEKPSGLTALANRVKGMGQMGGATVEIALARLSDGSRVMVAGINSSATWTAEQLAELARLGIEVAPQAARRMRRAPHAEENIAAHISSLGGRGERWSRAVVGRGGSYVCHACQSMVRTIGGVIEEGL